MKRGLAVTIFEGSPEEYNYLVLDLRNIRTVQVMSSEDLLGLNVIDVEENPEHPLYAEAVTRMKSRIPPAQ